MRYKLIIIFLILIVSACAAGPKYAVMKNNIPSIQADNGRIYFYRPTFGYLGGGIQPTVLLNGQEVGESVPGSFFYLDRPAGNYEVLLTTEVDRKLTFTLNKGQLRFVRMTVGMGVLIYRVYPELIDRAEAETELEDLNLLEKKKD